MACEALQATVNSLRQQLTDAKTMASHSTGADRAALLQDIRDLQNQLTAAETDLANCLQQQPPPLPVVAAPREILDIQWTNPSPPDQSAQDWAAQIVGGTGTFPAESGGAAYEWLQVLDPTNEYDDSPVGATGWIIQPEVTLVDFPFLHPFGNDFEFYLALDVPRDGQPADPNYAPLLAPGNGTDTKQEKRATDLGVPSAVLGVEMDGGLVPSDVVSSIHEGDRVAVFGRWIIDTGHYYPSLDGTPNPGFRTEIHPPLLMACANTHKSAVVGGFDVTRAVFTSRPYLVGQTFTTNLDSIYLDGVDDDGTFYSHMSKEGTRLIIQSNQLEAHPKIKSQPFRGPHLFHIMVSPPPLPPPRGFGAGMGAVRPMPRHLSISFRFTVRSGCAVQVTSDGAVVDVFVAMNSVGYTPPNLPTRTDVIWSKQQLIQQNPEVADAFHRLDGIPSWGSPDDGVKTDSYSSVNAPVLGQDGAVLSALPTSIPAGQGVATNDAQPYPVTGWLEVGWQEEAPVVLGGP